ncbi:hypothetical protein GC174_03575 [bacterium]|nr:hypothetical protein [bacterium]
MDRLLGRIEQSRGNLKKAVYDLTRARIATESLYGKNTVESVLESGHLARLLVDDRRVEEALKTYGDATAVLRDVDIKPFQYPALREFFFGYIRLLKKQGMDAEIADLRNKWPDLL